MNSTAYSAEVQMCTIHTWSSHKLCPGSTRTVISGLQMRTRETAFMDRRLTPCHGGCSH